MKKLLLALAAAASLLAPATAHPYHAPRHEYHQRDFRLFIYNYNPVYVGTYWLGYDGIYRCTRPQYGTVGVLTDDWGRVMTRYNFYGTPRYRLRCR